MSLEETDTANPREGAEAVPGFGETLYNEDGHLRTDFTEAVRAAVADGERDAVIELIDPLHESELGDLLEALTAEERQGLVRIAGEDFDFSSLTEVDEAIRLDIVGSLPNAAIAEAIQDLDSDDAIY
ncbi:MAG: magnesium transporter, partial [Nitratireductor sp.]|nr:magnesium transporter [Nitratireductor sp.]